ncbi:MAG TPA: hypothetical protein VHB99_19440 [Pirellulales bacterium]|nr:hypothetical protein [Pirellulales bacterium]
MRMPFVLILGLVLFTIAANAQVPERLEPYPLPAKALKGLTKLAAESDVLVLGETHGTQETPAVAAALLAPLGKLGYKALALEVPADDQHALVDWASGKTETVPRFFAQPFADGRGNIQTLALIRTAMSPPYNWRLICFDASWNSLFDEPLKPDKTANKPTAPPQDPAAIYVRRDAAMAANVAKERAKLGRDVKVLAICGDFHARTSLGRPSDDPQQKQFDDFAGKFWPSFAAAMASEHRDWRVRSVNILPHSGGFYGMAGGIDEAPKVGVQPIRSNQKIDEAEAHALEGQPYDWVLNLPRATPATFLVPPKTELD